LRRHVIRSRHSVVVQLRFELRSSNQSDFTSVEYTIDRAKPEIRQALFQPMSSGIPRLGYEIGVSESLAKNHPEAFADGDRLVEELAVAEILFFFARDQYDWQLEPLGLSGKRQRQRP